MTTPRPDQPTAHAGHDLVRVAEAADRDGRLPIELAGCPDCVALHADLVALAAALPAAATPTRPRDFTLSPADAARLRPRGWRRILRGIASPADAVTRPLAIGLTTLGLAGLLVAIVPGILPGGVGGTTSTSGPLLAPAAAPAAEPMTTSTAPEMAASPAAEATDDGVFSGVDTGDPAPSPPIDETAGRQSSPPGVEAAVRDDASGVSPLVVVAGVLLIAGLGLFGLRWTARRLD